MELPFKIILPLTFNEPVTWNVLPEANARFFLLEFEVPFPIIKADFA